MLMFQLNVIVNSVLQEVGAFACFRLSPLILTVANVSIMTLDLLIISADSNSLSEAFFSDSFRRE